MSKLKILYIFTIMFLFAASPILSAQIIKDDFRVNDDAVGGYNISPDVELLESGESIIVWRDVRNGPSNIYGRSYYSTGEPIVSNFKVSSYNGNNSEYTPVISSYGDSLLAIWEYGHGQWFLPDGTKEGSAFYLNSGNIFRPDVAVSDSGIFLVWDFGVSGVGQEIFLKRFTFDGDSIASRIVVNDDEGIEDQQFAAIAMNDSGNFVVVWKDDRNGENYSDIFGQLFAPPCTPIGGNFRINDTPLQNDFQYQPSCAMNPTGEFVVCWTDTRDGNVNIYGQRFDNTGSAIGSNFLIIHESSNNNQYQSSCAIDSAGNFVVVWRDDRDGHSCIYGQLFDNTGDSVGVNFKVGQNAGSENDYSPQISINENHFVVTWERFISSYGYSDIWKRRFAKDGTPVINEYKVNNTEGTADQMLPNIDMNTSGYTVITWEDERTPDGIYFQLLDASGNTIGGNSHIASGYEPDIAISEDSSFAITYNYYDSIYYQRFHPSGDSIGSPFVISDTFSGAKSKVAIDIDSDNNSIVAWQDRRSGNFDIYAQIVDSGGNTIGNNFEVNDPGTATQLGPSVAMSPSGNFLITWYDMRDGNYDIYGQVYQSDGTPTGSNFRIDSGGTVQQYYPSAGSFPDGNFIVAWQDYRIPSGIYAQIIDSAGALIDTNFKVSSTPGYDPSISIAPSGAFVITWQNYYSGEHDIYAQKYNADYSPDSTNFKVNNETEGPNTQQEDPCVATNGSRIVFAWEDPKWQRGYDIAAKVLGWGQGGIEEVGQEGKGVKILNISNPILSSKEWLSISLDSPSRVNFQIINVAGIVVSSKELTYTTPGIKRVEFDVSKMPCGPYFLTFETDRGRAIKKTVVIR
jgi:hypothetical protein